MHIHHIYIYMYICTYRGIRHISKNILSSFLTNTELFLKELCIHNRPQYKLLVSHIRFFSKVWEKRPISIYPKRGYYRALFSDIFPWYISSLIYLYFSLIFFLWYIFVFLIFSLWCILIVLIFLLWYFSIFLWYSSDIFLWYIFFFFLWYRALFKRSEKRALHL